MGREGLEPSRPFGQEILSLQCLPFHHRPIAAFKILPCSGDFVNHFSLPFFLMRLLPSKKRKILPLIQIIDAACKIGDNRCRAGVKNSSYRGINQVDSPMSNGVNSTNLSPEQVVRGVYDVIVV